MLRLSKELNVKTHKKSLCFCHYIALSLYGGIYIYVNVYTVKNKCIYSKTLLADGESYIARKLMAKP